MKTTIEVKGFEIVIDETEETLIVTATKDGETVEEFELSLSEDGESEDMDMGSEDEVQDFEDSEDTEGSDDDSDLEDLEDSDDLEGSDDDSEVEVEEEEEESDEVKLESFQSFINKRK
jgi:hypothetical protein